jgi:hypothetical protein
LHDLQRATKFWESQNSHGRPVSNASNADTGKWSHVVATFKHPGVAHTPPAVITTARDSRLHRAVPYKCR